MSRWTFKLGVAALVALSAMLAARTALLPLAQPADPVAVATRYYAALKAGDLGAAVKLVRGSAQVRFVAQVMEMFQDQRIFGSPPRNVQPSSLIRCEVNLKNLATGLEMYSTDNAGRFPRDLARVAPRYLETVPTCPAANRDTYSHTYQSSSNPDAFTVACGGRNHAGAGLAAGFPQYTSKGGLLGREDFGTPSLRRAIWTLDSARVLEQELKGDRSTVRVDETYAVYGYPVHVLVDFALRREGGDWKIDPTAMGGDALVASLKEAVEYEGHQSREQTAAAATRLKKLLTMNGMGWAVAALCAPPDQQALGAFLLEYKRQGELLGCKSNLKNTGTALEMYCTDNGGLFPPALSFLTPNYLKKIPTCPAAGSDTYSGGFKSRARPDVYTVICTGSNHSALGIPANHPQYRSNEGLVCPEPKGGNTP